MHIYGTCMHRTLEFYLELSRSPEAVHLKDGVPIFQNLQQNRKSNEREIFYEPRLLKNFQKISEKMKFMHCMFHIYALL